MKDTAPGKDGIQARMIRYLPGNFNNTMLDLFNEMWAKGVLPDQWSEAIQIPIWVYEKKKYHRSNNKTRNGYTGRND